MKMLVTALALALTPALSGCVSTYAAPPAAEAQAKVIPFETATVHRDRATGVHHLQWQAPGVHRVAFYAGESPDRIDRDHAVATVIATNHVKVHGLDPARRWYFALVPDRGAELVVAKRSLQLSTAPNLRDAGGYRTRDGRWVKMGIVYRSDQLDRLDPPDLARLSSLQIGTIADMRTGTERKREPDRIPPGTRHIILDVAADGAGSLGGDMRQAMAQIAAGRGVALLTEANRDFVKQPSARAAYGDLLRTIATDKQSLLYHCTAGKDRTGWASAVLLTLLGVPRETVIQDYLDSNDYLAEKNRRTMEQAGKSAAAFDPRNLEPVLTVRRDYLAAAFAEMEQRHGSMENYARDALGIDAAMLQRLRSRMLTGAPPAKAASSN